MKNISRRRFLKASLLTAGTVGVLPGSGLLWPKASAQSSVHARVRGANEDIRVAVVGFNGRGNDHIKELTGLKGVRLVALCDVDSKVLERGVRTMKDRNELVEGYQDIRKLLENPDIDAISIATPNHWHSLAAIWAVQAGKDVYVEKPCSHNTFEGRQLVSAVKKYNRICQHGSQSRSNPGMIDAIQKVQNGTIGDIYLGRALCYKWRQSIGRATSESVPAGVNYDLWTGPAPMKPF